MKLYGVLIGQTICFGKFLSINQLYNIYTHFTKNTLPKKILSNMDLKSTAAFQIF